MLTHEILCEGMWQGTVGSRCRPLRSRSFHGCRSWAVRLQPGQGVISIAERILQPVAPSLCVWTADCKLHSSAAWSRRPLLVHLQQPPPQYRNDDKCSTLSP